MNKMKNIKKSFVKNSFWAFISMILNRIGVLVLTVILARFLMPEGYGLYALTLSVAMIFYVFEDLGVNATLMRYVSAALKRNKKQVSSYYRYLLKIKLYLSVVISLIFLILSYPLAYYVFNNPKLFAPFVAASAYIFILSIESFHSFIFYSIEKVRYFSIRESLSAMLKLIFVTTLFYTVAYAHYILGVFISYFLVSLIVLAYSLYYTKKFVPELYEKPTISINKKKVRKFAEFLTIASLSGAFLYYIDSIIIGMFTSPEYVGYYRIALSLVISTTAFIDFPHLVLLSVFSKMKNKEAARAFSTAFRYFFISAFPVIVGIILVGKYIIGMLFGYSYLPAALPLYFLSISIFPMSMAGIFLSFFSSKEKPEIPAKIIMFTALINIILNVLLINLFLLISPLWATVGAAIATLISWTFYFVFSAHSAKKEFKDFYIPVKEAVKPLIASAVMGISLWYALTLIKDMNLIWGITLILSGAAVYFATMIAIKGLKKEDIDIIKILLKRS